MFLLCACDSGSHNPNHLEQTFGSRKTILFVSTKSLDQSRFLCFTVIRDHALEEGKSHTSFSKHDSSSVKISLRRERHEVFLLLLKRRFRCTRSCVFFAVQNRHSLSIRASTIEFCSTTVHVAHNFTLWQPNGDNSALISCRKTGTSANNRVASNCHAPKSLLLRIDHLFPGGTTAKTAVQHEIDVENEGCHTRISTTIELPYFASKLCTRAQQGTKYQDGTVVIESGKSVALK